MNNLKFDKLGHLRSKLRYLITIFFSGILYLLIPYFFLACWTSTASLSVGLVMPMLSIGALYGRMIGESLVLWFGEYYYYGECQKITCCNSMAKYNLIFQGISTEIKMHIIHGWIQVR